MADLYCRRCATTFDGPLPAPYGAICPRCIAHGNVVTLTDPPTASHDGRLTTHVHESGLSGRFRSQALPPRSRRQ